ncbi:MAG: hypothetical protein JNM56_37110 [Planctomycetia bacterium]|nr:hypothetical protein [Planctomycetia bacterium]
MSWRFLIILATISCLAARDHSPLFGSLLKASFASSQHDDLPTDNPEEPLLPEGEEVKRLAADSIDDFFRLSLTSPDAPPYLGSPLHDSILSEFASSKELLNTLHRLLI